MTMISLELPDELARRVAPYHDRLPEIIELGLRQLNEPEAGVEPDRYALKQKVLAALQSSGLVTLPKSETATQSRIRQTPIKAGGKPASEIIIEQRGKL